MQLRRRRGILENDRIQYIPVGRITPNPNQPRHQFDRRELSELADSIREHGILQPLTVRRREKGFELVSGERRLRAARLAGLGEVPCLIAGVDEETSSLLALVENLQRRDLDFMEEARAIARLIDNFGLSQEQAAARLGKSQSAVANKLRLLRLSPETVDTLQQYNLTERHARALLRLEGEKERRDALLRITAEGLNVAQTEALVERLVKNSAEAQDPLPPKGRRRYVIKDVRLFLNTVDRGLHMMKTAGINARWSREDSADAILLTITIPKS
ncbi:MAG TPA: ParB/RepB/Spo0J family partition protein [Oscillospiraceae bacterium]|nr:ParB/RepB/Spo0J family partition protein [Oscillospiraceae bacterium]